MSVTKIKADLGEDQRVETGGLKINDDWTGLFVRGDNAFHYSMHLKTVLSVLTDEQKEKLGFSVPIVEDLVNVIDGDVIER